MADDLVGCLSDNRANHYRFDKLKGRIRSAVWIAGVAQLVEQRIRNAKVVGSTPISGTTISPIYTYNSITYGYISEGTPQLTPQLSGSRASIWGATVPCPIVINCIT